MSKAQETDDTRRPSDAAAEKLAVVAAFDSFCAAVTLEHQNIAELHRQIVAREIESSCAAGLLAEAAQLATRDFRELTAEAQRLIRRHSEQALLDPVAAEATAVEVAAEVESRVPRFRRLRTRQREIAESLHSLLVAAVD